MRIQSTPTACGQAYDQRHTMKVLASRNTLPLVLFLVFLPVVASSRCPPTSLATTMSLGRVEIPSGQCLHADLPGYATSSYEFQSCETKSIPLSLGDAADCCLGAGVLQAQDQ